MLPTFIWPAATQLQTSRSRAMARTARWSVLSRDASLNGPPSEWSFPRSVRSLRSAEAPMSVVGPSRHFGKNPEFGRYRGTTDMAELDAGLAPVVGDPTRTLGRREIIL